MNPKTLIPAMLLALIPLAPLRADNHAVVRNLDGTAYAQGIGDEGRTQSLTVNTPILEGDNVWTDQSAKAGLLLQDGTFLWLDGNTRVEVDRLPGDGSDELRARLWKGILLLEVRPIATDRTSCTLATPSASLITARAGLYLIEVESVDRSRVTCIEGSCTVESAGQAVALAPRQTTYADYGYPPLSPVDEDSMTASILRYRDDAFPRRTFAGSSDSSRYLPQDLRAYSNDFDTYGAWVYSEPYGYVWRPYGLASDWAPYTAGRWWWGPWGMTWVPAEAWGWAPFHYGRWTFLAGIGWGWCPAAYFAPAWVAFYWGDAGWLGWCPLGWDNRPYWSHCGWYSAPVTNIYVNNINPVIVRHRQSPPPTPIYPRAQGTPGGVLRGGGPRGGGDAVSPVNISPSRVRDYNDGRASLRDIRSSLEEPVSPRTSRAFPPVQPSGSGGVRPGSTTPLPPIRSSGDGSSWPGSSRDTRVVRPSGGTAPDASGGGRTRTGGSSTGDVPGSQTRDRWTPTERPAPRPAPVERPSWGDRSPGGTRVAPAPSPRSMPDRSEAPQRTPRVDRSFESPRSIPSRPSLGIGGGNRGSSKPPSPPPPPPKASSGGGNGRHRR